MCASYLPVALGDIPIAGLLPSAIGFESLKRDIRILQLQLSDGLK